MCSPNRNTGMYPYSTMKKLVRKKLIYYYMHIGEILIRICTSAEYYNIFVCIVASMTFMETVGVRNYPLSVSYHADQLYVGLDNNHGVNIIKGGICSPIIPLDRVRVDCIQQYNDQIYTLCWYNGWAVRVQSQDFKLVCYWTHDELSKNYKKLAIYQNTVYIPNYSKNKISSYTLSGARAGHDIAICISKGWTSICVTPSGILIYTQNSSSLVSAFRLSDRTELWSCRDLDSPLGTTCDSRTEQLLVCTGGHSKTVCIQIIDSRTGQSPVQNMLCYVKTNNRQARISVQNTENTII